MVDIHRIPSYIVLLDVLHHQLQRRVAVVGVLLDGVADIERLHVLDMRIVLVHAESNAVYRCVRLVVDQFQFDMFQVFPYQLAGPVILDSERAEYGLLVVRAERIHLFNSLMNLALISCRSSTASISICGVICSGMISSAASLRNRWVKASRFSSFRERPAAYVWPPKFPTGRGSFRLLCICRIP